MLFLDVRARCVAVAFPVGGTHVQLHVAGPQVPVDLDLGVEEVGARVGVEQSRVDHTHLEPVVGHHVAVAVQAVLPYVLHEFFHNANLVISCCSGMC